MAAGNGPSDDRTRDERTWRKPESIVPTVTRPPIPIAPVAAVEPVFSTPLEPAMAAPLGATPSPAFDAGLSVALPIRLDIHHT
jgi:hypothetical protein